MHLYEDFSDVRDSSHGSENIFLNVSWVSAVAQQILWNCLIEDPALVLRHFLEKLTVSNRQVGKHPTNTHTQPQIW